MVYSCEHCKHRVSGRAVVWGDVILHDYCVEEYRYKRDGLVHKCPKCNATGTVPDPSGKMQSVSIPLAIGEDPDCSYGGCMGCTQCIKRIKYRDVPVQVTCPLCNGQKRLRDKPEPIMGVIGWKTGAK